MEREEKDSGKLLRERARWWTGRGVKGWAKGDGGLTGLKRSDERAAAGDAQSETGAGGRGGEAGRRHGCAAEMLRLQGMREGAAPLLQAHAGASGRRGGQAVSGGGGRRRRCH